MTLSWMQGLDDGRILYSTYIEALLQALNGKYVLSGLSCSTDGASLNVNIEAGTVRYDGVDYNYAGGSVTLNIGEVDRDRVDVIVWDYNGGSPAISVLQGSRWLNIGGSLKPMSERISDTQIPLAVVIVRAGATSIEVIDVYDVRVTADMVVKLSDLQIDADKDWGGKKIVGLGGLWLATTAAFPNNQGGFVAWNYPSGTGATAFFNHHGVGNTEYIFYSTTDWSNFTELLRITNSNAQFNVHILPKTNNTYDIGSSSLRFKDLHLAGKIVFGDGTELSSAAGDQLSLDASQITSGRLSLSRLPTSATASRYLVVRTANVLRRLLQEDYHCQDCQHQQRPVGI